MTTSHMNQFNTPILFMAIELSFNTWKLAFTNGQAKKPRIRDVKAGNPEQLLREIEKAKQKFQMPTDCAVISCYEAGRDGFWIHRFLCANGVQNIVVDSSSIEVNRRQRRAKTDRLDVNKLVATLMRWAGGEANVWSIVNPPTPEQEDARQLHRELETLKKERTAHINRIKTLLVSVGIRIKIINRHFPRYLAEREQRNQEPAPPKMKERILREFERMKLVVAQIRDLEMQRAECLRRASKATNPDPVLSQIIRLMELRAISVNSAWLFVHEVFGWRKIKNRRQLAALLGLTPTPFRSGDIGRDQGISKSGNKRMRAMCVEIAWCWLHYQPQSKLSKWFEHRFGSGSSRQRRIGIVAVARKLIIALWKLLRDGEIPDGAEFKKEFLTFRYTPSLS